MEYYPPGCFPGKREVPGNNLLIALMGELTPPAGTLRSRLVLMQGHMAAGVTPAPCRHAGEILLYLLDGAVLARVGDEEAKLIAGSSLRIPASTPYRFSTRETTGMTAVVILPSGEKTELGRDLDSCEAPVLADGLSITGEPAVMAWSSLAILRCLTPLTSAGCRLATVEMARGSGNRNAIFASLLPQYAADPRALRALIWACNAHPAAPWWLDRQRAQDALRQSIEKLLTH